VTRPAIARLPLALVVVALGVAACSDHTAPIPSGPAILRITSGGSGTDTILSTLPQLLTVRVTDSAGQPFVGMVVRFDAAEIVASDGLTSSATMIYAAPPDTGRLTDALVLRTDGQGRAQARVILGNKAGAGAMLITVPDAGVQDTARYVIKPGKPFQVYTTIADTAVLTGATFTVPFNVIDYFGNHVTDPPIFTVGPALVRIDANGAATAGDQAGRSWVEARVNGLADTMMVSVVPHWTVTASEPTSGDFWSIVTSALDGTAKRVLYRGGAATQMPHWSPAGDAIVYNEDVAGTRRLYVLTLDGIRRRLIASPPSILHTEWLASFSHDGQWVYFTADALDPIGGSGITGWRVRADGTGAEQLLRPDQSIQGIYPGPSPDGTHYIAMRNGTLFIVNLATSAWDSLGVAGEQAQYSPAGDRIAYIQVRPGLMGPLWVMNSDGSAPRQLTLDSRLYNQYDGFGWSPDGQFLIARGPNNLELIRVSDGLILPLPFSRSLLQPALKP
jgi:hypothetical protein